MSDNDFDSFLEQIAKEINDNEVFNFGKELGFELAQIRRFKAGNIRDQTYEGTLNMLRDWCQAKNMTNRRGDLKAALEKAGIDRLVQKYFSADESENSPVQLPIHAIKTLESPSIFISYEWGKQPEVKELFSRLTGLGYHCWLDIQQMGGGDRLEHEIDKGVRNAKVVISCVTPKYVLSENCKREVSLSDRLHKPIIPLLLEETKWPPEGSMGMPFAQLLYINFTKERTEARFKGEKFEELIKKINEHLQTTTPKAKEQLQGASSSQTLQTSHRSAGETLENSSGKQDDFEKT